MPSRFFTAAALSAVSLLGACDQAPKTAERPSRPVLVTTVQFKAEAPARSFVGAVKPRIESDLGFRVGG